MRSAKWSDFLEPKYYYFDLAKWCNKTLKFIFAWRISLSLSPYLSVCCVVGNVLIALRVHKIDETRHWIVVFVPVGWFILCAACRIQSFGIQKQFIFFCASQTTAFWTMARLECRKRSGGSTMFEYTVVVAVLLCVIHSTNSHFFMEEHPHMDRTCFCEVRNTAKLTEIYV